MTAAGTHPAGVPHGGLAALFGADAPSAGDARRTTTRALDAADAAVVARACARLGLRAETPFVAAWTLLVARWAGAPALDLDTAARAHLATVDGARVRGAASTEAEWAWGAEPHAAGRALLAFATAAVGEGLALQLDAPTSIAPTLAQRLLERIAQVARTLCADDDMRLRDIDVLGDAERARLDAWNPPLHHGDPQATVPRAFAAQVAARADAPAVVHHAERLSYRELDARSARLAARLRAAGVRPGATVAVALDRSATAVVALLAVLRCGAAYLPLDAAYPPARLAFMLGDARATVVLTSSTRADAFRATADIVVLRVDAEDAHAADDRQGDPEPQPAAAAADIAYVMYTSGSTGTPKGVPVPHDAILRLVQDARYVRLAPDAVVLHAAPVGFDASTFEIWGPLLNGACCVIHPEDRPTPAGLAATIRAEGVTTAFLTTALLNAIVADDPQHLRGLHELLFGGEMVSVAHVRRLQEALPALQLRHVYGPTECTTFATMHPVPALGASARTVPIGRPITDTQAFVLGPGRVRLPAGLVGRLHLGGRGLAPGYLHRPELTAERFVQSPDAPGTRLYDTGDLVRQGDDGAIEFLGRADQQVKIRGFRIELGEIEAALAAHAAIQACAVVDVRDAAGSVSLAAYVVLRPGKEPPPTPALRAHLAQTLPDFMLPAAVVWLPALPINANGKIDRAALPAPAPVRPELSTPYEAPRGADEALLCAVFAEVLGLDRVGRLDNFFELGGDSLQVMKALARLARDGGPVLAPTSFFRDPTPRSLARGLGDDGVPEAPAARAPAAAPVGGAEPIAIIGMAGRFPGAADVEAFWDNLRAGLDGVTHFRDDELDPALDSALVGDPAYVKARGVVAGIDLFDPGFFGISPREADVMDPQQRVFMELCWECLERAGHGPDTPDADTGPVGVFAGMYHATYDRFHVRGRPDLVDKVGEFAAMLASEKDFIATRIAHRLNLTGPAISLQTACSTSLVAIAQAFWALREGQCRMALAGGSSLTCPPRSGYLYQDGAMLSPDGRTRSFDAQAQGTVFSDGAAVVLLKRLSEALADGDEVIALIRGVAVNNDGRAKASFSAPSVDGQAAVIAQALAVAGVAPREIGYVEAHGTATPLGDPVEVAALAQAFRDGAQGTDDAGFCRLGSLKSNVGHMVIAAGAAGVIKTALALAHEHIPATIHVERPNPRIAFAGSPFVVADTPSAWPRGAVPRRAGVSSFGVGGTNAHAVLEEAPARAPAAPALGPQRLQLSARSPAALAAMATRLADHLERHPDANLADVAFTLQHGRAAFTQRLGVVAETVPDAVAALRTPGHALRRAGAVGARVPGTVWLFPGQGAQYPGMGRALAAHDPHFARAFDEALAACAPALAFDLRARLADERPEALQSTEATQAALFCVEFALAQAWLARGLRPAALVGHSVGEFVAAVLAGVMSLADGARLVARRGALMQAMPAGAMLSVRLGIEEVGRRLPDGLSLAAENGPAACVVAGPSAQVAAFAAALEAEGVASRPLPASHAFHSAMMEAAVAPFEALVREVALRVPTLPIVSSTTGTWLTPAEAVDPAYWGRHLRETVRFSPALRCAAAACPDGVLLEVGPRQVLSTLAAQHGPGMAPAVASLGEAPGDEAARLRLAEARLWTLGVTLRSEAATPAAGRRRVRLPTYPFERTRHWIEAAPQGRAAVVAVTSPAASPEPAVAPPPLTSSPAMSTSPPASRRASLIDRLRDLVGDVAGLDLSTVDPAASFVEVGIDSLMLTQVAMQTKKRFGVAVTFRQMSESLRSFDALAAHLDATMPAEAGCGVTAAAVPAVPVQPAAAAVAAAAAPAFAMPAALPAADAGGGLVQQVIQQQMALMAQQLALLAGPPQAVATTPAAASPMPAAAPAPAAPTAPAEDGGVVRYDVKKAFGAIARIHTQAAEVTAQQRARLETFMRRYVEKTARSKTYTSAHRPHLADPRVVNGFRPFTKEITYQIVIERSRGSHMWDLDGNDYVDVLSGFGMNLFGWAPEFVQEAVRKQLDAGYDIGPQHPVAGEVADLLCEMTGHDRAALCNTGSEAVMAAIRIARTVTCRNTIVLFTGSYHGTFDEVLVRAGRNAKGIPAAPGIMADVFDDVRVLDYGTPEALEFIRTHADDLAAVLVEPVQSRRPEFQPREFLQQVREITAASGTCLIFDEVITGFRMHQGGIQALFDIRADLCTYGKVIGGGMPIGAVAGKRAFMDALDGGAWQYGDDSVPSVGVTYFAGTFVRHPLALAASRAALQHIKQQGPQLQEQLNLTTAAMASELTAFCREVGAPIEIRHFGSLFRVAWLEDHPLQDLLFAMMRNRGVHILDNFPCFLTTAHTPQDIATIKSAFKEAVAELQQSEFIPARPAPEAQAMDLSKPPVPGARLGRGPDGQARWFVPNPEQPGKFIVVR